MRSHLKICEGELSEEKYAALKGLKYRTGNNFGASIYVAEDGEQTGYCKFVLEGISPYNMTSVP